MFDNSILFLIIISSIKLAIDNPLTNPHSFFAVVLGYVDIIFNFCFIFEAMVKIISFGFFFSSIEHEAYIRNGWNILDFFVVCASIVDMIFPDGG